MEWISVKDRLPDLDEDVDLLVITDDKNIELLRYYKVNKWYSGFYCKCIEQTCCRYKEKVTHWAPLPNPPHNERCVEFYEGNAMLDLDAPKNYKCVDSCPLKSKGMD